MKHGLKKRILSLVLCISMVLPMIAQPMPVYSVENEESIAPLSNPFTPETIIMLPDGTTTKSQSYRIPSMVTLADGTIVAAADIRWNTTFDGGGLDTLVARSTDGGANWSYTVANYLGDNGNVYNGSMSTTFIDPNLLVAADGQTIYMLVDLYAYGVALNGNGSQIQPVADTGFDTNGNLKLSNNNHSSYDYYLKDGKIYNSSNQVEEGYTVDPYFNITYTLAGENKESNLFFADSPFKVARTQYLYLTKSTDGGATWSEPNLLDVRAKAKVAATENALLVSPGNSITTSSGIMVYPVYSYKTDGTQHVALIYSTDGVNWMRSLDYTALNWSSEGAIVELENGNIRVFVRNKTKHLCYVDFDVRTMTWIGHADTGVPANSNTQLSAITYSKTANGDQVVLISCPTGPNGAGSDNNDGSMRTNGKIHVFTVNATGEMTLQNTVNLFENLATGALSDNYTETKGFFAYSSLTERADGSVALLYENNQFGWGASGSNGNGTYNPENVKTYYTITAKTFDKFDLLGGMSVEEGVREKVALKSGVSTVTLYREPQADMADAVTVDASELDDVYYISDRYYNVATGTLLYQLTCCVGASWPADGDGYLYVPANLVEQTDEGIAYPIVDFTNAAPYNQTAAASPISTFASRMISTYGATDGVENGLSLSKAVKDNGDGTYTITLEAYTTGTVTVSQTTKPLDIVLVLDQSGSMAQCIGCGETIGSNSRHEETVYTPVSNPSTSTNSQTKYYIKSGSEYVQVYYCNRTSCNAWYTSNSHNRHYDGNRVQNGTQFYSGTTQNVSCVSRLNALKDAVQSFVDEVYAKSAGSDGVNGNADDVAHRIAIVGFASQNDYGYNTELLSINGNNSGTVGIKYNNISTEDYVAVLQDLSVAGSKAVLDTAIAALAAEGATEVNLGMTMAENIFKNNTVDLNQRDRITIMFTDGTPTTFSSYSSTVANGAIAAANTLKNTYRSTVYTVGVFEGADASSPSSLPANNDTGSNRENRFMHLVSSNYMNATAMNNTGTVNPNLTGDNGYYLSASNTDALSEIFKSISSSVGSSSSELDATAVVKDIVSPQFVAPAGTSAVAVYQIPYTPGAGSEWGTREQLDSSQVVTIENNTVNVTGFDFKHNFVAETGRDKNDLNKTGDFYGRKLQIVFTVSVDPDFLGGSDVPTNGADSGVYDSAGTCVGTFNQPVFAIPLRKISTVVQDKNVYLTNTVDLTSLLNLYVKRNDQQTDLQITVDGINNAYVDLKYTITLDNNTVAVYTIPAGKTWAEGIWTENKGKLLQNYLASDDTLFAVKCVMSDAAEDSKLDPSSTEATGTATVKVFKPTITFTDVTKTPKKDSVNYNDDNLVGVVWKHDNTLSTDQNITVEGTMPTLTCTYAPDAGCVDGTGLVVTYEEFHVNVTEVLSNGMNIIGGVTFEHTNCSGICGFDSDNGEFMIHLTQVFTSLVIEKAGWEAIDPNQSFLFHVEGEDVDLIVTVHGNNPTTINGLKVGGEYTVTELTNWSWRYVYTSYSTSLSHESVTNGAKVVLETDGNEITFTNTREENKWLDGDYWLDNLFKRN